MPHVIANSLLIDHISCLSTRDQDKKGEDLGAESVIEIQPVVTEEITVVCTEEKTPLEM